MRRVERIPRIFPPSERGAESSCSLYESCVERIRRCTALCTKCVCALPKTQQLEDAP